jgi:hypothetical protein
MRSAAPLVHPWERVVCLTVQLLGRASEVGEFVRRGQDSGEVTIWLSMGSGRPLTVTRKIRRDNTSDWKLNGEAHSRTRCVGKPALFFASRTVSTWRWAPLVTLGLHAPLSLQDSKAR